MKRLTVEDLEPLVPFSDVRRELRGMLLDHATVQVLPVDQVLEVNFEDFGAYVLEGAVDVESAEGVIASFSAGIKGRHPLGEPAAGASRIVAVADARVLMVDRRRIDTLLTWSELYLDGERPDTWLVPVLRSELLARLPAASVHALLRSAVAREVAAGVQIVTQGEPGDTYYLLVSGSCAVMRDTEAGLPLVIAHLEPGDSFGEEALLTDEVRNATVETQDEGATVLAISRANFECLVRGPLVKTVDFADLARPLDAASCIIDVRSAAEFTHDQIAGARNTALADLRDVRDTLPQHMHYLVHCDSGRRSAAAAFLLTEWGFSAAVLTGKPATAPAASGPDTRQRLATANAELEHALTTTADLSAGDLEATDPDLRARIDAAKAEMLAAGREQAGLERSLREDEAERARAEAELRALHERLAIETKVRLEDERARLHHFYASVEAQIVSLHESRQRLGDAAAEAHARIDTDLATETERLDQEMASARAQIVVERERSGVRIDDIAAERKQRERMLVDESEARLKAERQRLESAVAQSVSVLQDAERRLAAAEQERLSAKARAAEDAALLLESQVLPPSAPADDLELLVTNDDEMKAAHSAVAKERLRLNMQQEIESLLDNETKDVADRQHAAQRQLEEVGRMRRDAEARDSHEEEAEQTLMEDISEQLGHALADPDIGAAERAAGAQAYARTHSQLVADAVHSSEEQRRASSEALARARRHLERLRRISEGDEF